MKMNHDIFWQVATQIQEPLDLLNYLLAYPQYVRKNPYFHLLNPHKFGWRAFDFEKIYRDCKNKEHVASRLLSKMHNDPRIYADLHNGHRTNELLKRMNINIPLDANFTITYLSPNYQLRVFHENKGVSERIYELNQIYFILFRISSLSENGYYVPILASSTDPIYWIRKLRDDYGPFL